MTEVERRTAINYIKDLKKTKSGCAIIWLDMAILALENVNILEISNSNSLKEDWKRVFKEL